MGLREWLMILGGLVLLLIIADGIRRMRKVDTQDEQMDEEERARQEQLQRELPSGGARIIKSHDVEVFDDDPIPVLRHEVDIPAADEEPPVSLSAEASADLARSLDTSASYDEQPFESSRADESDVAPQPEAELSAEANEASAYEPSFDEPEVEANVAGSDDAASDESYYESSDPDSAEAMAFAEQAEAEDDAYFAGESESAHEQASSDSNTPDESVQAEADAAQSAADDLHITEFDAVDNNLDDLEPLEPLEKRFAAAKARRLEEEQKLDLQKQKEAEAEAAALEEVDPVKAAVRRIQGKHTGPRPSERMKMQSPANEEMSLAERQYRQQQEAAHKAQAAALKAEQQKAESAKEAQKAAAEPEPKSDPRPAKAESASEAAPQTRTTFKERPVTRKPMMSADEERGQIADADELLVMHVKCKDERGFHGAALLHIVMQCGMQIGDMKVFHRFAKTEDGPQIQFSMLSSVEPGTFDIDQIDDLYIPSVSFVMGLPAPGNSQECFTMMLETAKVIVRHMSGELRDENRSVMTPQTIEHYKQRIQDFERRKQLERMR